LNYRNNMVGKISEMGFTGDFGVCGSMISVIPAQPEPSNGACHWDIPTTMERYVHVTSKSLVDAVQPFEQSHGSVEIPTPFWCKNGVQKQACCLSKTASSLLIPVCADGAGRRRECRPSPPSDTPYSQDHSAQLWCRCQTFGECQQLFSL